MELLCNQYTNPNLFKVCSLLLIQVDKGMRFVGGESAALSRVHEYFWKKAGQLCS